MASKRDEGRGTRVTFGRSPPPTYRDKNVNIIYGINKAWKSLADLKEKLSNTEVKIVQSATTTKPSSRVPTKVPRKRKMVRLDDNNKRPEDVVTLPRAMTKLPVECRRVQQSNHIEPEVPTRLSPHRSKDIARSRATSKVNVIGRPSSLSPPPSSSRVKGRPFVNFAEDDESPTAAYKSMAPINMSWEPFVQLPVSGQINDIHFDDVFTRRPTSITVKDRIVHETSRVNADGEIPLRISEAATAASDRHVIGSEQPITPSDVQDRAAEADARNGRRQMKRKIVVCRPEKIDRAIIDPYAWRKGRELIIKELGVFSHEPLLVSTGDDHQERVRSKDTSPDNGECLKMDPESPTSGEVVAAVEPRTKQLKKPSKRTVQSNAKKKPIASDVSTGQSSTPKLRHYDRTSVRRYIHEQRKERRKKADLNKVELETKKVDRQVKLKELSQKQHEILKTVRKVEEPTATTTGGSSERYIESKPHGLPPSLTWIDLGSTSKGIKKLMDNANDDFAYVRPTSNGRVNRVFRWEFARETSSSDERQSSSLSGSSTCPHERDDRRSWSVRRADNAKSKQVTDKLKILAEESRKVVDDLMAGTSPRPRKVSGDETVTSDVTHGRRAARLESLKQQALTLQSAIEEETQRLKRSLLTASAAANRPKPSSSIRDDLSGIFVVGANKNSVEADLKSAADQVLHETSLSEGPLTENELDRNVESEAPSRTGTSSPAEQWQTDDILQLVLANTVFAKPSIAASSRSSKGDDDDDGVRPSKPPSSLERQERNFVVDNYANSRNSFQSRRQKASKEHGSLTYEVSRTISSNSGRNSTGSSSILPDFASVNRSFEHNTPTHSSMSYATLTDGRDSRNVDSNRGPILDRLSDEVIGTTTPSAATSAVEDYDDEEAGLSEGPLSSETSDMGERSRIDNADGPVNRASVHSRPVESDGTKDSATDGPTGESENRDVFQIPEHDSEDRSLSVKKMSPSALRLRMSAELTYLDTVHESLGHLTDMERVRAVSVAQQEAVALAQVVQARVNGQINSGMMAPNLPVLQSQAEAAKLSAEAIKLLAETNGTLVTSRVGDTSGLRSEDAVAAATAAAVTAALSQMQLNLRRHKDRTKSFLSNISSNPSSTERSEESLESEEADSDDSQKFVGGNKSQTVGTESERKQTDSSSAVQEELMSEGPLSPATSSDIREEISPSREVSEGGGGADHESFTEEDEELSFRALLPSEGHLRSSRRRWNDEPKPRRRRTTVTGSPSSDDQRSSVSSSEPVDAVETAEEADDGGNDGDRLDDVPLFSGEESFRRFTMSMVKQYMQEEAMRTRHQQAVHRLREKAVVDKANLNLAWIELQKKRCLMKGQDDKIPPLSNKEQGLSWRLEKDTALDKTSTADVGGQQPLMAPDVLSAGDGEMDPSTRLPPITSQVLQGLKKLQASKRYLTRREQKLHLRRKDVEELLTWQRLLDSEEARVLEMEHMALTLLGPSNGVQLPVSTAGDTSVVVATVIADEVIRSVDPSEREKCISEVVRDERTLSGGRGPSVVLRSSLTPQRSKPRIRRESSGSEDSYTVSQSETTSELSEIEGRVHALKEDLRRRKVEAERLRREQRRKNKERLRAQEASLLRQIDAYDNFIARTRSDLQKELEKQADVTTSGVSQGVRPVIKQPKVAESKRIQRQTNVVDGGSSEARSEDEPNRVPVLRESEMSVSPQTSVESAAEEQNISDSHSQKSASEFRNRLDGESEEHEDANPASDSKDLDEGTGRVDGDMRGAESAAVPDSVHEGTLSFKSEITEEIEVVGVTAAAVTDSSSGSSSLELSKTKSEDRLQHPVLAEPVNGPSLTGAAGGEDGSDDVRTVETKTVNDVQRRAVLVDDIVETILSRLMREELTGRLKPSVAISETAVVASEAAVGPRPSRSLVDRLCDDLMTNVLDEAIVDCIRIRREQSAVNPDEPVSKSVLEEDILSNSADRRFSLDGDSLDGRTPKSRPRDLFVLSADCTLSSRNGDDGHRRHRVPSPTGCELPIASSAEDVEPSSSMGTTSVSKEQESKPDRNVFTEGDTLSPETLANSNADVGEQEWFEEDYGLGRNESLKHLSSEIDAHQETTTQDPEQQLMHHYQIYPFQDYFYIREIPNKPPPPYTPPGGGGRSGQSSSDATAVVGANGVVFSGTPISSADFKRLSAEVVSSVACGRRDTTRLVDGAVQCVLLDHSLDTYFTANDREEDIANRSRRAYKQFVLQLVRETATAIGEEERRPPCKPWSKPEWPSKSRRRFRGEELKSEVQRRVLLLLLSDAEDEDDDDVGGRKTVTSSSSSSMEPDRRKKRDVVDEILLRELRKEEAEWVDYDEDETTIKMQLADSILDDMIGDIAVFLTRQGTQFS